MTKKLNCNVNTCKRRVEIGQSVISRLTVRLEPSVTQAWPLPEDASIDPRPSETDANPPCRRIWSPANQVQGRKDPVVLRAITLKYRGNNYRLPFLYTPYQLFYVKCIFFNFFTFFTSGRYIT